MLVLHPQVDRVYILVKIVFIYGLLFAYLIFSKLNVNFIIKFKINTLLMNTLINNVKFLN